MKEKIRKEQEKKISAVRFCGELPGPIKYCSRVEGRLKAWKVTKSASTLNTKAVLGKPWLLKHLV